MEERKLQIYEPTEKGGLIVVIQATEKARRQLPWVLRE